MQRETPESNFSYHTQTTPMIWSLQLLPIDGSKEDLFYRWTKGPGPRQAFPLHQPPARYTHQRSFQKHVPCICGVAWLMENPRLSISPWFWTKLVSQLLHFHLGFKWQGDFSAPKPFPWIGYGDFNSVAGGTKTMERCINTCRFLETLTGHRPYLGFELVGHRDPLSLHPKGSSQAAYLG